jgi:hypothetical protein
MVTSFAQALHVLKISALIAVLLCLSNLFIAQDTQANLKKTTLAIVDLYVNVNNQLLVSVEPDFGNSSARASGYILQSDAKQVKWAIVFNDQHSASKIFMKVGAKLKAVGDPTFESNNHGNTWERSLEKIPFSNFYWKYSGKQYAISKVGEVFDAKIISNIPNMSAVDLGLRDEWGIVEHAGQLYVLAKGRLFISKDRGQEWREVQTNFPMPLAFEQFKVSDKGVLYVAVRDVNRSYKASSSQFILQSLDNGNSWERLTFGLPKDLELEIFAILDEFVYFKVVDEYVSRKLSLSNKIFRSDSSNTATRIWMDDVSIIRHGNKKEIYLARRGQPIIYKSVDAGLTFSEILLPPPERGTVLRPINF